MVAIAWSWLPPPRGSDTVAGTTFKATTTGGVTVRLAVPVTVPKVALIVAVPATWAIAAPAGLTLTIDSVELHVADCVRFCLVPSEKLPVAVNCSVSPTGKETWFGVTAILTKVDDEDPTVTDVLPV